jgi:tyrosinase
MTQPNQASVRVRQSVLNLTAVEMGHYVQAVQQLKATDAPGKDPSIPAAAVTSKIKVYDWYVQLHVDAMQHAVHKSPWFLPWHRQFILDFENALGLVGGYPDGLGLPYWDWAGDPPGKDGVNSAVWAANFMGGDGQPPFSPDDFGADVKDGPFAAGQWTLTITEGKPPTRNLRRGMGQDPGLGQDPAQRTLPTQPQVDDVLKRPAYDSAPWNAASPYATSFRNALDRDFSKSV